MANDSSSTQTSLRMTASVLQSLPVCLADIFPLPCPVALILLVQSGTAHCPGMRINAYSSCICGRISKTMFKFQLMVTNDPQYVQITPGTDLGVFWASVGVLILLSGEANI